MVMLPELLATLAALVVAAAEILHVRRYRRLARLAFGPSERPEVWARSAGAARALSAALLTWGLVTLMMLPPKVRRAEQVSDSDRRHLVIVYDVSPSMRLVDAGPDGSQSRRQRAAEVIGSIFKRAPMDQFLVSVIACYTGSKPVVVDTKDLDVVRNIFDELPMDHAFTAGETDLFSGLEEASRIAHPWVPRTASLILLSDGDTVPSTGMPTLPASINEVLIIGVGDPRNGSFINGGQSRQDAGMLRQIAARLGGTYHDANESHIPSDLVARLTLIPEPSPFERLSRREYALLASASGASMLALLPLLLHHSGTRWRPGTPRPDRPVRAARRGHQTTLRQFGGAVRTGHG
jgi:Ca-activated chloride channel family protein